MKMKEDCPDDMFRNVEIGIAEAQREKAQYLTSKMSESLMREFHPSQCCFDAAKKAMKKKVHFVRTKKKTSIIKHQTATLLLLRREQQVPFKGTFPLGVVEAMFA